MQVGEDLLARADVLTPELLGLIRDRAGDEWLARLWAAKEALAKARELFFFADRVPAAEALPRYVRDKVAKTTAERAAERAAHTAPPLPPTAAQPLHP